MESSGAEQRNHSGDTENHANDGIAVIGTFIGAFLFSCQSIHTVGCVKFFFFQIRKRLQEAASSKKLGDSHTDKQQNDDETQQRADIFGEGKKTAVRHPHQEQMGDRMHRTVPRAIFLAACSRA